MDPRAVFITHRQELVAWLTYRVRDAQLAQDLVQELFVQFVENPTANLVQDGRAYLFRMARNLLVDIARQSASRPMTAMTDNEMASIEATSPGPEQTLAGRQQLRHLADVLAELPALTQKIFVLNRVDELSYQQVADQLDISTSSVQKHLARALAHVMQRMKPQ